MSQCLAFKEAREHLVRAAVTFADLVRSSLEMWLQAAGDLSNIRPNHQTEPVMDLVGKALWQWPALQGEAKQLAWMQQHLPGISTAMHECVASLVNTSTRRVCILQSLRQQQGNLQLLDQLKAEDEVRIYIGVLKVTYLVILPVAVLVEQLSWSKGPVQRSAHTRHGHQQHRLQQGNNLISRVGSTVAVQAYKPIELHKQMQQIDEGLAELGTPPFKPYPTITRYTLCAAAAAAAASMQWLRMAVLLEHADAAEFLVHIDWRAFQKLLLSPSERATARYLLSLAVIQPKLRSTMNEMLRPKTVQALLVEFGVTPGYLQALDPDLMPAYHMRDVLAVLHESGPHVDPGSEAGHVLPVSLADSRKKAEDAGIQPVAVDSTDLSVAEFDGDLDDMKTLLRMMYGSSIA